MEIKKKLVLFIVLLLLFLITLKIVGNVVVTPSSVIIDLGYIVLADTFNGDTTDFASLNDSQLGVIENMNLERTSYGKIIFNNLTNITIDAVGYIIDLDSNVNISSNFISIKVNNMTSLNKTAIVSIYNLGFTNARILRNNEVCDGSICSLISYSSGILIFSVSDFNGNYSSEEVPYEPPVTSPVSGGGGGGVSRISNFTVDRDLIVVQVKQGQTERKIIKITNIGNIVLNFDISTSLDKFIAISENSFSLKPWESKTINLDIYAKEEESLDSYVGKILVSADSKTKSVNVIVEVLSKKPLFDLKTVVLTKTIGIGDSVEAEILIRNLGDLKNIDIFLYYAVKDFDDNIIAHSEESIAIRDRLEIVRDIKLPKNVAVGDYVFYTNLSYKTVYAASSDFFRIVELEKPLLRKETFVVLFIFLLLLLRFIIILIRKKKKKEEKDLKKKKKI